MRTPVRRKRYADSCATMSRRSIEMAVVDALTGLYNRRYLEASSAGSSTQARRKTGRSPLMMFDIDHFKTVNDVHGHAAGDNVLQAPSRPDQEN